MAVLAARTQALELQLHAAWAPAALAGLTLLAAALFPALPLRRFADPLLEVGALSGCTARHGQRTLTEGALPLCSR